MLLICELLLSPTPWWKFQTRIFSILNEEKMKNEMLLRGSGNKTTEHMRIDTKIQLNCEKNNDIILLSNRSLIAILTTFGKI